MSRADLVDLRQRCLDDGCYESTSTLVALLDDAKRNLTDIHIHSLDLAHAFDSVSHEDIVSALDEADLQSGFTVHITEAYSNI